MKKIFSTLVFVGSVLLLGTAGASDHNLIDGSQIILQVSIAAVLIAVGLIGQRVLKEIQREKRLWYSQYQKRKCRNTEICYIKYSINNNKVKRRI